MIQADSEESLSKLPVCAALAATAVPPRPSHSAPQCRTVARHAGHGDASAAVEIVKLSTSNHGQFNTGTGVTRKFKFSSTKLKLCISHWHGCTKRNGSETRRSRSP